MSEMNDPETGIENDAGRPESTPRPGVRLIVLLVVGTIVAGMLYLVARKLLAPLIGGV